MATRPAVAIALVGRGSPSKTAFVGSGSTTSTSTRSTFPDPDVPIAETLSILDEFIREGKVREIGCCNFTGPMLREASNAANEGGFRPFVSVQNSLNLFQRGALDDVLPVCQEFEMAFIPYYPLASGMLTGKYRRGMALPSDTRLTDGLMITAEARERLFSDRTFARLEALEKFRVGPGPLAR